MLMTTTSQKDLNPLIAAEVRAWLARTDMKQADLAACLGLSQSGVSHRLRGNVPFTVVELDAVAETFGITLYELLGPNVLHARRSPHTELIGAGAPGASAQLPRLDSNQQPFD